MSEQTSNSNSGLAFVVGALVVLVGGLIWWIATNQSNDGDVTISVEGVGEAVESAVTAEE